MLLIYYSYNMWYRYNVGDTTKDKSSVISVIQMCWLLWTLTYGQ